MDNEFEGRLAAVEGRAKSNTHRIDEIAKRQDDLEQLTSAVAALQKDIEYTQGDVQEIKTDVKALVSKPGKNWEKVCEYVLLAVIGALVGWCLSRIGL